MGTSIRRSAVVTHAAIVLAVTACASDERAAQARVVEDGGAVARTAVRSTANAQPSDVRAAIEARLSGARPPAVTAEQWRCVRALYDGSGGRPLWLDSTGRDTRARNLVRALANAPSHGLVVDPGQLDTLRAALVRVWEGAASPSAEDVATADVALSGAFVALAEDLAIGQLDPRAVTRAWYITPRRPEVDSAIVHAVATTPIDGVLSALAPDDPVYAALRAQLATYRRVVAEGGWKRVPRGPALRAGERGDSARLAMLVERLAREGYLTDSAVPAGDVYDARLAEAVTRFQTRHSITVDGILSAETMRALDVTADYRAAQIAANLERIRWLPRASSVGRHLIINVPSFRLLLRDGTRTETAMRVVVGAEYRNRATPAFADSMSYVVFQPYWNVTPNIAIKEVIPKARRDAGYLARNDYEVVSGGGDNAPVVSSSLLTPAAVRAGRVRVRQRPGKLNALGHAKFIFPNDFHIYLHDTPQQDLFDRDVRAFSHGCIRVERPAELAQWVLGWDSTRVAEAMRSGRANVYVSLPAKLPVYIIYLTAFTRDGELVFGNDLYSRDDALVRRVASGALPSARVQAALDSLLVTARETVISRR